MRAVRVRVLPDVSGLDKEFDYAVPASLAGDVTGVGDVVRITLHGRRVDGWVTAVDPADEPVAAERLQPILAVASRGPAPELFALAGWASIRWAAGRLRPFLVAASPARRVRSLPPPRRRAGSVEASGPVGAAAERSIDDGVALLVLPPAVSPVDAIVAACRRGPTLAVVPAVGRAEAMAGALRRRGLSVAVVPRQWAEAAAGADVVIGPRVAAWAPCPGLAAAVVIDEHDEALQEERAPTWHARDVVIERAARAGAAVLLTSPAPTVAGYVAAGERYDRLPAGDEREGWPIVQLVDRSAEEPWRTSLVGSELIAHLRDRAEVVVCVHNTPGRGRVLACRACKALVRCERCDAAVVLADDGRLACPRCGVDRAAVCQQCGASSFANLRPGVTRLREELEAAAGRPAIAVTGATADPTIGDEAGVFVGTEAVLHRVARADVVAFLDIDRELLAPRYRAAEQTMALLARAARLLGPRRRGGRLLVQTFLPDHPVLRAAVLANPARLLPGELERRRELELPPAQALAELSGPGADDLTAALRADGSVTVGDAGGRSLARTKGWDHLGEALLAAKRASGSRARIVVDPSRS